MEHEPKLPEHGGSLSGHAGHRHGLQPTRSRVACVAVSIQPARRSLLAAGCRSGTWHSLRTALSVLPGLVAGDFGVLLANVRSVWESLLTWQVKGEHGWRRLAENYEDDESRRAYRQLFHELLEALATYFEVPRVQRARHTVGCCYAGQEEAELVAIARQQRAVVDRGIGRMRRLVQDMKCRGLPGGEVHRLDSYVNAVGVSFERLAALKEYRTPRALRSYARVYIIIMGALYAPDYVAIAGVSAPADVQLTVALVYACMIQVVMGSLFHVMIGLEDPFTGRRRGQPPLKRNLPLWDKELDGVCVPELVEGTRKQLLHIEREANLSWKEALSEMPLGRSEDMRET